MQCKQRKLCVISKTIMYNETVQICEFILINLLFSEKKKMFLLCHLLSFELHKIDLYRLDVLFMYKIPPSDIFKSCGHTFTTQIS